MGTLLSHQQAILVSDEDSVRKRRETTLQKPRVSFWSGEITKNLKKKEKSFIFLRLFDLLEKKL